ncbi:hypothetical protein [Bosea sp. 117]|uniref:hypothetical protein n=1 Tax=Bosea sp. 117 TaxID=1125973 RepID=UPI000494D434|nr:hypothetical protein [Bosea sp. 117]
MGFWNTFFNSSYMLAVLPEIIRVGIINTLSISIAATIVGILIGMPMSLLALSRVAVIRALGEIAADLVTGVKPAFDLAPFAIPSSLYTSSVPRQMFVP